MAYVELVEHQQRGIGQLPAQDRFSVFGDVPVQVALVVCQQRARQGGLAHQARTAEEDHLPVQVGGDLVLEVALHGVKLRDLWTGVKSTRE